METLKQQVQALGDQDFRDLKAWIVTTETDRRAAQPAVEQARAEDTQKLWEAHPELKPAFKTEEDIPQSGDALTLDELLAQYDQWVQPSGAHDALPTGAIVAHEGAIWRTDLPTLNAWEPGTMNTQWVDITGQLLAQSNQQAQGEDTGGRHQRRKARPRSRSSLRCQRGCRASPSPPASNSPSTARPTRCCSLTPRQLTGPRTPSPRCTRSSSRHTDRRAAQGNTHSPPLDTPSAGVYRARCPSACIPAAPAQHTTPEISCDLGAGDENRTRTLSLGS